MNVNELPQYKCHKVVRAGKIKAFGSGSAESSVSLEGDFDNSCLLLPHDWVKKHQPEIGGYLVAYEDGYLSYSPAAAFEAGYSLIIDKDCEGTVLTQKCDGTETLTFQGSTSLAHNQAFLVTWRKAEQLAYEYAHSLPEGEEREFALKIYHRVRMLFSNGKSGMDAVAMFGYDLTEEARQQEINRRAVDAVNALTADAAPANTIGFKWRKKPVVIEAHQWFSNGDHPLDYSKDHEGLENGVLKTFSSAERAANKWEGDIVRYYRNPEVEGSTACQHCGNFMNDHGWIDTLEGGHIVCPGDWIITGIKGELYPCKPDIFAATYELAAWDEAAIPPAFVDTKAETPAANMIGATGGPLASGRVNENLSTNYPRWHRGGLTTAFKVGQLNYAPDGKCVISPQDPTLASVTVPVEWCEMYAPRVGGYMVASTFDTPTGWVYQTPDYFEGNFQRYPD